jgi:hypothetical protein
MIYRVGQCHGQKVGLNPIVSSGGLYDRQIYLNEFFRIVGAVVSVYVVGFELV